MLNALMVDTITQRQLSVVDQWGETTYVEVSRKAYVEWKTRTVMGKDGSYVVSMATVRMAPLDVVTTSTGRGVNTIHAEDVIVVDGVSHRIVKLGKVKVLNQQYFTEVWIA